MDGQQFQNWCINNWTTEADILSACKIDKRTLNRWRESGPPERAINALKYWRGELRLWPGWRINAKAELCSPENAIFTPGLLRARPFMLEIEREYRIEIRGLKKQLAALKSELANSRFLRDAANDHFQPAIINTTRRT